MCFEQALVCHASYFLEQPEDPLHVVRIILESKRLVYILVGEGDAYITFVEVHSGWRLMLERVLCDIWIVLLDQMAHLERCHC